MPSILGMMALFHSAVQEGLQRRHRHPVLSLESQMDGEVFSQNLALTHRTGPRSYCGPTHKWFQDITWSGTFMVTIEEDLEMLATAIDMGIDPFPPPRKKRPWAKYAIASFMTIMILSWVSQYLMRFV